MRCGLFGKLPVKRDFIAEAVPRGFLQPYETWLQGAMGASRQALGSRWQDIYLQAPLWRFWLGASHCGQTVIGAFMPSIDGVGRYFPLTVMAMAEEKRVIAPPIEAPQAEWFDAVENFLLSTLDEGFGFDRVLAALEALPAPADRPAAESREGILAKPDGTIILPSGGTDIEATLKRLQAADDESLMGAGTFWWTIGGNDIGATALSCRRLPDQQLFSGFLTGRFEAL
ncbi:MAG: type VI secretion system-associated protein TagF [Ancalomicrobiaceae bacterium]|nr:type VI secretion system-associated protein TagF [Ancalomicrobiaceae bacterium]